MKIKQIIACIIIFPFIVLSLPFYFIRSFLFHISKLSIIVSILIGNIIRYTIGKLWIVLYKWSKK